MTAEFLTHASLSPRHGFFTRRGGVSTGAYASLNCSLSSGDAPGIVAQNRALVAASLGVDADHLVGATQVHGTEVITVVAPWPMGEGGRADGLVTAQKGIALSVITADCAPVLFRDARKAIVGAAHAGWRGAAAGILEATLTAMVRLGAAPGDVCAVVGPCIAQASYEVRDDLRDAVLPTLTTAEFFFAPGREGRWQFDLAGYCVARLTDAGVTAVSLGIDTCADEARFYSHRRRTLSGGGPIGHQISVVLC